MKKPVLIFPLIVFAILLASTALTLAQKKKPQFNSKELAKPLIGTDSKMSLSNGNTYPAAAVPWGINLWTAQTGKMGNGWAYTYDEDKIRGFKQTYQPSPWNTGYGKP